MKWILKAKQFIFALLGRTPTDTLSIGATIPLPTFHKEPKMPHEYSLILDRKIFTDKSTIGELLDSDHITKLCYTLEDTCRKHKIPGETAIPAGRYRLEFAEFGTTGKEYPMLIDVPFYVGVFLHGGNQKDHTRGCPLVGMRHGVDILYDSQKALNDIVIPRIRELMRTGDVYLTVLGGYAKEDWEVRNA